MKYKNIIKTNRFNGVYSRNNLTKIKDGTYVINLDGYKPAGTYWIALYMNGNNLTYFESFGVEHISREIKKFIDNRNITTNIIKIKAFDSIMYWNFFIGFIDFILKGKSLLEYRKLFSPSEYEKKNDTTILNYLQ